MTVLYPPFACVCSHFVKTPFCDKQIRKNRKVFSMHSLPLVCINELTSPYKKPSVVLTRREAQKRAGIQELKYRKGCRPSCHLWILNGLSHNSLYMHVSILRVYCTRSYTRVIQKGSVQSVIWWSHFPGYVKGLSCLWKKKEVCKLVRAWTSGAAKDVTYFHSSLHTILDHRFSLQTKNTWVVS